MGKGVKQRKNSSVNNPILRIPFSGADLGTPDSGGGGSKVFVDVSPQYRHALVEKLSKSIGYLSQQLDDYPDCLGTVILKLRENAIAKSHRPNKLVCEAGLRLAGHNKIDEMLVASNTNGFTGLRSIILERNIKEIVANLSAIEDIEAWDESRKIPHGLGDLIAADSIIIRPFSYSNEGLATDACNSIKNTLDNYNVSYSVLDRYNETPLIKLCEFPANKADFIKKLSLHPGIRTIVPEPVFTSLPVNSVSGDSVGDSHFPKPSGHLPTVAVFDTGVSPNAVSLTPWVSSSEVYVLPPDTLYEHGTMVASLISGARHLNNYHPWIPATPCTVHNVCALEESGSYISDLELRLRDAVSKRPDIKIWNLSLGGGCSSHDLFSEFAILLDRLSDEYNVLFVVAAGNYTDKPRRNWPNPSLLNGMDLVSTPGDSVRALTVGSVSHMDADDSLSAAGAPTPYSRRGPGPVFTPKPDVTHTGGGVHSPWSVGSSSLTVLGPDNCVNASFGTSFAAPIVASLAAHTWEQINQSDGFEVSPSVVKALLIHSAQISSPDYTPEERRYFGAGIPQEVVNTLYDTDDRFTLIFQTQLIPGMRWRKQNYPIPSSLIENGKFKGEVIITSVYAPPLDSNAGSEYVRANVELSFGLLDDDGRITGKVPMDGEKGTSGFESAQIEHGGKWSPVKIHRKSFPKGVKHGNWAIQAKVTLRANEPILSDPLPVIVIVTLRSLDNNANVYSDGVRAVNANNWVNTPLPVRLPITV